MGCILTKCVMVRAYFWPKVSIVRMVRFLHKTELLFNESLRSVRYWTAVPNLKFFIWVLSADKK